MALTNQQIYPITVTSADGLVGGITLPCKGFRNVDFQFYTPALSAFVVKFVCSMQEAKPDFTSASSATNMWTYAQNINLNDGSSVTGSTGITFSGETSVAGEINENNSGIMWIGAIMSGRSAGTLTGVYTLSNNA
jgi:hypothetical protein